MVGRHLDEKESLVEYMHMNLGSSEMKLVYLFTFTIGAGIGYYLYRIVMG